MQEKTPHQLCENNCTPKQILFLFFSLIGTFLFAQKPIITSFSPASGPVGTSVVITGSNFSSVASDNIVFFGAVRAAVVAATATSITVSVPIGATYQPITVTTNGLTSYSAAPFIVTFPGGSTISGNSFEEKIDSTTDSRPNGIAVADFDGDGKPDLATANNIGSDIYPGSVSVLRNNNHNDKKIAFEKKIDLVTGGATYAIASGDLNRDGKPEIVICSVVDKKISIFRNTSIPGKISFDNKIDYVSGEYPASIAINDIDVDGKPDIVVANRLSNTVSIFRNTGGSENISFASKVDLSTASGPVGVSISDVNNDGKPDIVAVNIVSNSISIFKNLSSPGTISFTFKLDLNTGQTPRSIAINDLNNDNKPDIVVVNAAAQTVSILRNTTSSGSLSFATKLDFPCSRSSYLVSVGDLNGDGKPDLVIPGDYFSILQNLSTPSSIAFANPSYFFLYPGAFAVGIVDMDGDGLDDIAATIFTGEKISLLRNRNNEPIIESFNPAIAGTGTIDTITGTNFLGATSVKFGDIPASSFTIIDNSTIIAVVGSGVSGTVSVANQYGMGELDGFTFAGPPIITSFTPDSGSINQTITITGNNLSNVNSVRFGDTAATSFTIISANTIKAVLGRGATGIVTVTTPYGTNSKAGFKYIPLPSITSFAPKTGILGSVISITGTNFTGTTAVNFGGVAASSFVVNSPTNISAVVGQGSSGNISITTNYGTGNIDGFTFIPAPIVSAFFPNPARTGTLVTITGLNFTGVTRVNFGGLPADSFQIVSSDTLTAIIGSGASGDLMINGPGGTDTVSGFSFIPPPKITSITPDIGHAGTIITITGTGFSPIIDSNKVTIGSIATTVKSATSTMLTIISPQVATNQSLNVRVNNLSASTDLPYRTSFMAADSFTDASFTIPFKFHGGISPYNVLSVDLDGDGKLDIVSPNKVDKRISALRNTSIGNIISFSPKVEFDNGYVPYLVASGDIDGDGKIDLISNREGVLTIFRNNSPVGSISFDPKVDYTVTTKFGWIKVATGDIDGDGRLDAVVRFEDSIIIFKNKSTIGKISFENPVSYFIGPMPMSGADHNLLVEDLNGDGRPEVIVNSWKLYCLVNQSAPGKISFSSEIFTTLTYAQYIAIADVNGDGKKDILASSSALGLVVYQNQSPADKLFFKVNQIINPPLSFGGITLGDLNGDGKPEIIALLGGFLVLQNTSSNDTVIFKEKISYPYSQFSYYHFNNVKIADIDADNKMDAIITIFNTDSIFIFRNLMGVINTQLCSNGNTSISSNLTGNSYQWQQNSGTGFANINNNTNYNGTTTINLKLNNIPSSWYGYQYRCLVDGNVSDNSKIVFSNKWTGIVNNQWENPGNWSCGSIPDANTDVYISGGTIILNSNTTVRSIKIQPQANLTVASGFSLVITH